MDANPVNIRATAASVGGTRAVVSQILGADSAALSSTPKMKIKALAFVGIPVTDMKCARTFYENVLGLRVAEEMMGGKWVEYSLGNNTLAIASVGPEWLPSNQGTGAALEVEDFDEAVRYLKDRNVPFTTEPFESPCCRMAIIKDPDGNNIVIHKLKPENEKEPCL